MSKTEFIEKIDSELKLIRTEAGFTQETMAQIIGISKKTLVQIEKGRASLGWTGAVAVCTIFSQSAVLDRLLGGEASDMIRAYAFEDIKAPVYNKTMGGKVWWREIEKPEGYKVQQNIVSQHYRILDDEDRRIFSSFDFGEILERVRELERGSK